MRQDSVHRHFPTLLGHLPRMLVSLSRLLVAGVRKYIRELLLAIPFLGLFLYSVAGAWGIPVVMGPAIVTSGIVLSLSYLVLLLMLNQRRDQRRTRRNSSKAMRTD